MTQVVCLLNVEPEKATFTWSEGPASFEPYFLEGQCLADFKAIALEVRAKLSNLVNDYLYAGEKVWESAHALAESGHELYQQIFDPGIGQLTIAREVHKWLEELHDRRAVESLEIVVESPWAMPWNVVYDRPPEKQLFLTNCDSGAHWEPFWGVRYNLVGGRKVNPLRRLPLIENPDIFLVVDPRIQAGLPQEQQQRLNQFVASHAVTLISSKDELIAAARAERPEILYWLSHATPAALMLGDEEITPRELRKMLRRDDIDNPYELGGLAFLNACQTAEGSGNSSFFEALYSVGFSGMVGTEQQTVDTFAAPLGLDFLEAFIDGGESVGEVLHHLRRRVPLGLLYGVYCPPAIKITRASDRGDTEGNKQTPYQSGTVLGAQPATHKKLAALPSDPYRSLAYYERADRGLFAGRDADIERFASLLDQTGTRVIVLHGESGVGKSSFLRAGVIPYLEEECLGYQFLRGRNNSDLSSDQDDSVLFVRATNDPFGQIAQVLCDYCAAPVHYQTPTGDDITIDLPCILSECLGQPVDPAALRAALRHEAQMLAVILAAISRRLPYCLVLVIDQFEEVFTLAQTAADAGTRRLAIAMLQHASTASGDFKILLALRTEYYGRLIDRLRSGLSDTDGVREYLLTDFAEENLIAAIKRPTETSLPLYSSEVPCEKYGFRYASGVPEEIARRVMSYTIQRHDSVLPLMQVICEQLYRNAKQRDRKEITIDDLEALGGIEGGMRQHVVNLVDRLVASYPSDRRAVKHLLTQLYIRQPDGSLTTALLPEEVVARRWSGRMPFEQLLPAAERMRLLRVNTLRIGGHQEGRYVSLGHDALAKLAATWDEELGRGARMRKMARVVGAVSTLAVLMAILAGLAFFQMRIADIAKGEAEQNLAVANRAVETMLTEVGSEQLKDVPQMESIRAKLLEEALGLYEGMLNRTPTDDRSRFAVAMAHYWVAQVQRIRGGDENEAKNHFDEAIESLEQLAAEDPSNFEYPQLLADSYNYKGVLLSDYDKEKENAESAYDKSLQVRTRLVTDLQARVANPDKANVEKKLLNGKLELARTRYNQGNLLSGPSDKQKKAAQQAYQEAKDILTKLIDAEPFEAEPLADDLARRRQLLARVHNALAEGTDAVAEYDSSIQILRDLRDAYPNNQEFKSELAMYLKNSAETYIGQPPSADANQAIDEAIRLFEELNQGTPSMQEELANAYSTKGALFHKSQPNEAAKWYERAIAIFESSKDSLTTKSVKFQSRRLIFKTNVALLRRDEGQLDTAIDLYSKALGGFVSAVDDEAEQSEEYFQAACFTAPFLLHRDQKQEEYRQRVFDFLEKAAEKGFHDVDRLKEKAAKDGDLETISADSRFESLLERLRYEKGDSHQK